jgi:hypothetical protein
LGQVTIRAMMMKSLTILPRFALGRIKTLPHTAGGNSS